jgi:hypothetical protein
MNEKYFGYLPTEEITLFIQMTNYDNSQKTIKDIIKNNKSCEIDLYLINDDWLNKWKHYSCLDLYNFDQIKNNIKKWNEKRKEIKKKGIKLDKINNADLIQFNNRSVMDNAKLYSFNPKKYFHLVTKECFDSFVEGEGNNKEVQAIKFTFISNNKKIMANSDNKIIVLFENDEKLNLVFFISQSSSYDYFYQKIKKLDMTQILNEFQIDDTIETKDIIINENKIKYKIYYMNKSYNINEILKKLIIGLINNEKFFKSLKSNKDKNINEHYFYLINNNWFENFLKLLKFDNIYNKEINEINNEVEKIKAEIFKFQNIIKEKNKIKKNREENNIFNYLFHNDTNRIIKYYTNYTLITED